MNRLSVGGRHIATALGAEIEGLEVMTAKDPLPGPSPIARSGPESQGQGQGNDGRRQAAIDVALQIIETQAVG